MQAQRSPRLLIVDDDTFLLRAVSRLLALHDVSAVTTPDGDEALSTLALDRDFDLVLFDMCMPSMAGPEFFRRARDLCPELHQRFVVMSGDVANRAVRELAADGECRILAKPFAPHQVVGLLGAPLSDR